jgi:hypothetical protein
MKLSCKEGEFKILKPARSTKGYWIVGAIVGSDSKGMTYTTRCPDRKSCFSEMLRLRDRIFKDHPGIREIFGEQ